MVHSMTVCKVRYILRGVKHKLVEMFYLFEEGLVPSGRKNIKVFKAAVFLREKL